MRITSLTALDMSYPGIYVKREDILDRLRDVLEEIARGEMIVATNRMACAAMVQIIADIPPSDAAQMVHSVFSAEELRVLAIPPLGKVPPISTSRTTPALKRRRASRPSRD